MDQVHERVNLRMGLRDWHWLMCQSSLPGETTAASAAPLERRWSLHRNQSADSIGNPHEFCGFFWLRAKRVALDEVCDCRLAIQAHFAHLLPQAFQRPIEPQAGGRFTDFQQVGHLGISHLLKVAQGQNLAIEGAQALNQRLQ